MKTVAVTVQADHLHTVSRVRKPISAVAELIWNGLDADATRVSVSISVNAMSGPEKVIVRDNGTGIRYEESEAAFQNLGGSWKKTARRTAQGRLLHGQEGKGRFKAFGISSSVEWKTRYREDHRVAEYTISGSTAHLDRFEISDLSGVSDAGSGTDVTLYLDKPYQSLLSDKARQELAEQLALYLLQYPNIIVEYDGERVDPSVVTTRRETIPLDEVEVEDNRKITAELTVIEWSHATDRALYLCDQAGFTLAQVAPGIQAPGFDFTGYLRSDYLRELDAQGFLDLEEIHPGLSKLIEAAREKLRDYFRRRAAEQTTEIVEEWKRDQIYPYSGEPKDVVEQAERQVFDVVALNVNAYLRDFDAADRRSKKFSLRLLRQAIETDPSSLQSIMQEVLDLPPEKQKELAELLKRTSLAAIINASKIVSDRLNFIRGLELLVFDPESKETLLERAELHRILADHTWIFGEQFNISVDDESLTEVLKKHLALLGREELVEKPVRDEGGSIRIVDLMLSESIPTHHLNEREHLVVELKRPEQKIDDKVENQVINYAVTVARDERFREVKTRWDFWAISNELSETVRRKANQRNRPEGLLYEDAEAQIFVWAKTWGQIIQDCKTRLDFFQQRLNYKADQQSAIEYLRKTHEKYLPAVFKTGK